jgi:hypothetical protein
MKARAWLLLGLCGPVLAAAADQPPAFSSGGLEGWTAESILNEKATQYSVVEDGGAKVVQAQCEDSASMEGWAGPVDLGQTPLLAWRWKIEHLYPGLDERIKGGSDFPARIYVVTGKRWLPWTLRTIEYAWSNGEVKAASWPSPYSGAMGQAVIVPVRSGADGVGTWQEQQRDVKADFKQFFNLDLDKIGAVALMSDCDDAHGKGRAWYGDLRFLPRPPGKPEMSALPEEH